MWYVIKQYELFIDTAEIIRSSENRSEVTENWDYFVMLDKDFYKWVDDKKLEAGYLINGKKKMREEGYGLSLDKYEKQRKSTSTTVGITSL